MLEFTKQRLRAVAGGTTRREIEAAFPARVLLSGEPAPTAGLGWPLTRPRWFRLRSPGADASTHVEGER